MLKRIEIEGFKSFKDKAIIDFEKTKYLGLEEINTCSNGLTKGAVIFGSNASGKSTILRAIQFLFEELVMESSTDFLQSFCAFSDKNFFRLKYEFIFNNDLIEYEIIRKRYKTGKEHYEEEVKINNKLFMTRLKGNAKRYVDGELVEYSGLDRDILFLRTEHFSKGFKEKSMREFFEFAQNSVYLNMFRLIILSGVKKLSLKEYLDSNGTKEVNDFLEANNFVHRMDYLTFKNDDSKHMKIDNVFNSVIISRRTDVNLVLNYKAESDGTYNLFNILPAYLHCIKKPSILLVDEFCSGFSNELEELMIRYFFNKTSSSQMIVVTHSTNVISNTLFRPDQMYKIDFLEGNGSVAYRISNSQPRPGQNIEKMFLGNAFGSSKGFFYRNVDK